MRVCTRFDDTSPRRGFAARMLERSAPRRSLHVGADGVEARSDGLGHPFRATLSAPPLCRTSRCCAYRSDTNERPASELAWQARPAVRFCRATGFGIRRFAHAQNQTLAGRRVPDDASRRIGRPACRSRFGDLAVRRSIDAGSTIGRARRIRRGGVVAPRAFLSTESSASAPAATNELATI